MFSKFFASAKADKARSFGDVSVMREGRRWKGGYSVKDGGLLVSSAWGSRSEVANRTGGVSEQATKILGQIVDARDPEPERT
jgi:hypothetical protein